METKELPLTTSALPLISNPIAKGFLHGQYANLFKFAVWWTTLAPLSFALMDKDAEAIGVARIVYNVALCILSPLGGILVERVHPRKILNCAAGARFIIWCIMVPLSWFLFDSSVVITSQSAMYVLFNVAMFFDGAAVAMSAILDIDLAGVDVIAGRYGLDVTDDDRNYFNSRQELCFALCFIILAPGTAFLGLAFKNAFEDGKDDVRLTEGGTLIAVFFIVFLIATAMQFFFFKKLPDESPDASPPEGEANATVAEGAIQQADVTPEEPQSFLQQAKGVPGDLLESLKVIWSSKPILFRLVFLGLEIAFEDAAIVVIAAQMGIFLPWLGDDNAVQGNIWTSLGVASGKLGGAIASLLMMKFFTPPDSSRGFVGVFGLIFISCLFILVFPAIVEAHDNGHLSDNASRALYLTTFFFYFFFSTLPKLGLMCLFQSMISQIENGPRVFGFVAIIAMTFDALVVMVLSVLFTHFEFKHALWITAFIYLGHGVLELICGPILVLMPLAEAPAEGDASKDVEEGDATTSMASKGAEATLIPVAETEVPKETRAQSYIGSYRGRGTHMSRLDAATESYYTQRSAAVPVTNPADLPSNLAGEPDKIESVVAVMSISKNFAYGSLARRKSVMTPHSNFNQTSQREADANAYGSLHSRSHLIHMNDPSSPGALTSSSYVRKGSTLLRPARTKQQSALN